MRTMRCVRFYKCLVVSPYGVKTIYSSRDEEALKQFIYENFFSEQGAKGFRVNPISNNYLRLKDGEKLMDEYRTDICAHTWC